MPESVTNRRLATILFADMSGYSRLMRADEERTLDDLRGMLQRNAGHALLSPAGAGIAPWATA